MATKSGYINSFTQLFTEVKDYMKLQDDYVKIDIVEKITKILSMLLFILVVLVLAMGLLFYLLFSLAYILGPEIGFVSSFAIIAGIYLILLVVIVAFRKSLIINPLLRIIVGMFYEEEKIETEGNETDNG